MKYQDKYNEDEILDQMFQSARTEKPKYQFSEASAVLTRGLALGATSAAHAKMITSTLFKSKFIIMSVSATTIFASTVLIYSSLQGSNEVKIKAEKPLEENTISVINSSEEEQKQATDQRYLAQFVSYDVPEISNENGTATNSETFSKAIVIDQNSRNHASKPVDKEVIADNEPESIRFTITEQTTLEELKNMKEVAKDAGIRLSYKAKMRRNVIKSLQVTMRSEDKSMFKRISVGNTLRSPQFSIDLAWFVDENGQFTGLDDRNTANNHFEGDPEKDMAQLEDDMALLDLEMDRMDAEMVRQNEIMMLMEPKMQKMDSLMRIHSQLLDALNEKLEVFLVVSEEQNQLLLKRDKLDEKRLSQIDADKNTEKLDKEIEQYDDKIGGLEQRLTRYQNEMNPIEEELNAIGEQMDGVAREMDDLDELMTESDITMTEIDKEISADSIQIMRSINKNTTVAELNMIKEEAASYGVNFDYKNKGTGQTVRLKKLKMTLKNSKKSQLEQTIEGFGYLNKYEINIIWKLDENEQAYGFDINYPEMKPLEVKPLKSVPLENKLVNIQENREPLVSQKVVKTTPVEEGNLKRVYHVLTSETTENELREIQEEALKSGIDFYYVSKYKKDKLVHLQIQMKIVKDNGTKMDSNSFVGTKRRGSFSKPIIWRVNESGQAVDFGDPNAMCSF